MPRRSFFGSGGMAARLLPSSRLERRRGAPVVDCCDRMVAIAHFVAVTLYMAAAALAAIPFARPIPAPVRGVVALLVLGIVAHAAALGDFVRVHGQPPVT